MKKSDKTVKHIITIDIDEFYDRLRLQSERDYRSVEDEIRYFISQGLSRCENYATSCIFPNMTNHHPFDNLATNPKDMLPRNAETYGNVRKSMQPINETVYSPVGEDFCL